MTYPFITLMVTFLVDLKRKKAALYNLPEGHTLWSLSFM